MCLILPIPYVSNVFQPAQVLEVYLVLCAPLQFNDIQLQFQRSWPSCGPSLFIYLLAIEKSLLHQVGWVE